MYSSLLESGAGVAPPLGQHLLGNSGFLQLCDRTFLDHVAEAAGPGEQEHLLLKHAQLLPNHHFASAQQAQPVHNSLPTFLF